MRVRVVMQTASSEGLAERRIDAIRDALVTAGVDEARIATNVSDSIENDQAILLIEKAAAPPA